MVSWERLIKPVGARRIVIALGALFITAAVARGYVRIDAGTAASSALFVSIFTAIPGILLIIGGYRLPKAEIHPDYFSTVVKWTFSGSIAMVLFLIAYNFVVEGGISNPDRAFTILPSFSTLAGFGLGIREAKTKTREQEVVETVERLRESNKRLEQFAYAASHDLQEPLRMISSYLQLIERRYEDDLDEDGQEFLEHAVDGADRMRAMVDALLVYSRIDTEEETFTTVDLEDVVEDVVADLQVTIDESGAEITIDDLPQVEGDRTQLQQLIQNLVSNAIEYTENGPPSVHISAKKNGLNWTVSLRDEGIGIEPSEQDDIFEVFTRLHSRDEHPGTGIGLALCQRIIERHDGEIWVESTPGEGSTFSFTLPAASSRNT